MPSIDLSDMQLTAETVAAEWGLELGPMFAMSNYSFVAPVGDGLVLKAQFPDDEESLHEGEVLELWAGDGAVRLERFDAANRVLLEERAVPGSDLSELPEQEATAIAVDIGTRLWKPAAAPFRPVLPEIVRWLRHAEIEGSTLVPLARELLVELDPSADWICHGDLHHHNILRHGDRWVAIDPKPYATEREYDVPSFLWNPMWSDLSDPGRREDRIAAFAAVGLDEWRIRAWTVIRGSYLRSDGSWDSQLRAVLL
jgi:streptomycin 6-kinase